MEMRDEMRIKTGFMKGIIGYVVKKLLRKNLNIDIDIQLEDLDVEFDGDNANVRITIDGRMTKDELFRLIKEKI